MPIRIQRKRTRGWRMPPNTVSVTRPGPFGNIFIVNPNVKAGSKSGVAYICVPTREDAVECFREMVNQDTPQMQRYREMVRSELAGKDVACFCRVDELCHGDVLLELASR